MVDKYADKLNSQVLIINKLKLKRLNPKNSYATNQRISREIVFAKAKLKDLLIRLSKVGQGNYITVRYDIVYPIGYTYSYYNSYVNVTESDIRELFRVQEMIYGYKINILEIKDIKTQNCVVRL